MRHKKRVLYKIMFILICKFLSTMIFKNTKKYVLIPVMKITVNIAASDAV